jgi:hypothetical protein
MTYIAIHVTSGAARIGEMGQPLALDEDLVQFFARILRHFPLFRFLFYSFFVSSPRDGNAGVSQRRYTQLRSFLLCVSLLIIEQGQGARASSGHQQRSSRLAESVCYGLRGLCVRLYTSLVFDRARQLNIIRFQTYCFGLAYIHQASLYKADTKCSSLKHAL